MILYKFSEKREFNKFRREKTSDEIETLKNEIGILYELAANWKSFEEKQDKIGRKLCKVRFLVIYAM